MVNLVTIGEDKYVVDVGFGANGPIRPLKLDRSGPILPHIGPASMRLSWGNIQQNTDPNQRLWIYSHRINDNSDFQETYCFTELEFLPNDYAVMNYATSTRADSIFKQMLVCLKHVLGGDDGEEVIGVVILQTDLKWRIRGEKVHEQKFETEEDRLQALEDVFRIKFSPAERDGIRQQVTEIKKPVGFA
jgi:arylamine N-acetyltransferase